MKTFETFDDRYSNVTAVYTPRWVEILSACWLFIILIGGTLLNGLTIFVFTRNRHLITNNNLLVLALVFHDLGLSCVATEMPILAELTGHWLHLMSMKACVFEAFLVYFVGLASMFILVAMAVSRYIAITRPFLATRLSKYHSVFVICLSDFLALCFAVPPLFGWGSYGLEAHGTSCGLDWRDTTDSFLSYLITITVVCLAIPAVVMIFCYARIYITVKETGMNCVSNGNHSQTTRSEKERLLLKLSIAFVLCFILSWTPYTIASFYVAYGRPETIDPLLSRSAAIIAKSQVLWNPILYIGFTDSFRRCAFDLFKCRKRNRPADVNVVTSHAISNRQVTEQTVTTGNVIQRYFISSRFSGMSTNLNILRPIVSKTSISRKVNDVKKMNNRQNDCTQKIVDNHIKNIEEEQEDSLSLSQNTGLQADMHTDHSGISSIIDVKPDDVSLEKTKPTSSGMVEEDSVKINPITDALHTAVVKTSPQKLRDKKNDFCGAVELHIGRVSRKSDGNKVNTANMSSSTVPKIHRIVINVVDVNDELIPVD